MGLKVAFFGTPEFAATVLRGLLESRHDVVAVAAAADRPSGRGRKIRLGPVSALARERGLRLLQPTSLKPPEALDELRELNADVWAVASYGLIFTKAALQIPRIETINAHGSLLPLLRGAAPIERAILAGFTSTGISVQRVVRRVDAGDVYASRSVEIGANETAGELRERLAVVAAGLLPEVLDGIEEGTAARVPQDESKVTHAPPLQPGERALRWSESAEMASRRVRTFAPRPGAFALLPDELGRKRLKVLEAELLREDAAGCAPGEVVMARHGELIVAAREGALRLVTVQPEGKKPMPAGAFLSGHGVTRGQVFLDGMPSCPVPPKA